MNTKPLIICEMANNHMGDYSHGLLMIDQFANIVNKYEDFFSFAWKFQFRDLDSFIHKDYKNQLDHKYVKRFLETNLTKTDFYNLTQYAKEKNFITLATAFDESSVDLINEINLDIIKVASCSFTDWPLLNKIVDTTKDKQIILSTAGSSIEDIDRVVSFMQHRNRHIGLMHCVGEYPTETKNLQLNQIDLLKERYPNIPIGYSTHEHPEELSAIQIAIAKGINIAEKHVALQTEKYQPNAYSVTPQQMDLWLSNAHMALIMCGTSNRSTPSSKEIDDLNQFKRGMFAKTKITKNSIINKKDIYFAWPSTDNQILANDASKYNEFLTSVDIEPDTPIFKTDVIISNTREKIWQIVQEIKVFLAQTNVVYPGKAELEISHHHGLDNFHKYGSVMITVVNREYCKKLIIMLPGQEHPEQYHIEKEETFLVLYGTVDLKLDGLTQTLNKGDVITIEKNTKHEFITNTGCIIEEVSSTHIKNDSYYTDESITNNQNRKTFVTHWL
jgi:sialic acid synthase SpsE/quercetin dioxygenase-like cupin family protein